MTRLAQIAAGVLWTIAFGMMIVAPAVPRELWCMAWALLFSVTAAVVTGWVMLSCERQRVETIAQLAVQAARERRGLESI